MFPNRVNRVELAAKGGGNSGFEIRPVLCYNTGLPFKRRRDFVDEIGCAEPGITLS